MTGFAKRAAVDTGGRTQAIGARGHCCWRVARCEISSRRIYRIQPSIRA